ncbi:hypothetical protein [Motilibacter aurantiacus]|uniref:hypothetical protein n=1 Tax=Motilibacter aurantiacus TaxID=2714955 RepID=UPI00140B6C29|nr:hypothetical protein [Motilibacter aurantiacus]NHC46250.1 hypothetical protein [Motilibacter aurantiacus]
MLGCAPTPIEALRPVALRATVSPEKVAVSLPERRWHVTVDLRVDRPPHDEEIVVLADRLDDLTLSPAEEGCDLQVRLTVQDTSPVSAGATARAMAQSAIRRTSLQVSGRPALTVVIDGLPGSPGQEGRPQH